MKRYISIYLSIAPGTFEQMKQHVIDKDWDQLRIKAHSLKPQADYMGIQSLKSVLVKIEDDVISGSFANLETLFDSAQNIYKLSEGSLKEFVESH